MQSYTNGDDGSAQRFHVTYDGCEAINIAKIVSDLNLSFVIMKIMVTMVVISGTHRTRSDTDTEYWN